MFGFDKPEDGSEERFRDRVQAWRAGVPVEADLRSGPPAPYASSTPVVKHYVWWLIHNLVAHPAIGVAPVSWTFRFHDWTSRKLNGL